jgi:hypothetical protein
MFDITVEDPQKKGEKINVWQNSWYVSHIVLISASLQVFFNVCPCGLWT